MRVVIVLLLSLLLLMVLPHGINLRTRIHRVRSVRKLQRYLCWHHDRTLVVLGVCQHLLLTKSGESLLVAWNSLS